MRGLYIHIPFCKSICSYCDFPKLVSKQENHNIYINSLLEEIESYSMYLDDIDTVYIGGGTPNSLNLELLEKLLARIHPYLIKSKENTIELNSELVTEDLAKLLKKYNINRASIGVQTVKEESIKLLRRNHSKKTVKNAIQILRDYGINNINIDLIFGIPNTSIADVKNDLDFITKLNPTHISYYSLILEEKTIFSHLLKKGNLDLLDDDLVADMYDYINEELATLGYKHYEISNYALPGYESIHNMKYWNCQEYIGVGLGASGYLNSNRYTNHLSMNEYIKYRIATNEFIDIEERKKEYLLLGLRMIDGVSISKYSQLFNSDMVYDFNLSKLLKNNLLIIKNEYVKINKNKLFIANLIFEEFVGD